MVEIKERVYLNGTWVNDYFLTDEKNQELKDLRLDLTYESQTRAADDATLQSNVDSISTTILNEVANRQSADSAINAAIDTEVARAKTAETNIGNIINTTKTELEAAIATQNNTHINDINTITANVNTINTKKLDITEAANLYQTKSDAATQHNTLKTELEAFINSKVEGSNKWTSPVASFDNLPTDLDDSYTWLCKVQDTGYVYQLISGETTWQLYSTESDFFTEEDVDNKVALHNISNLAHNDIRTLITEKYTQATNYTNNQVSDAETRITQAYTTSINTTKSTLETQISNNNTLTETALGGKVDKVTGKQLSTEDYTTAEKTKLSNIAENANNYVLPADVVHDNKYVHTDNNFTTTYKNKLDGTTALFTTELKSAYDAAAAYTHKTLTFKLPPNVTKTFNTSADESIDLTTYFYSKTEIDTKLTNLSNYATVDQLNTSINTALADYYTKTEINNKNFALKTDLNSYYTKSEIDGKGFTTSTSVNNLITPLSNRVSAIETSMASSLSRVVNTDSAVVLEMQPDTFYQLNGVLQSAIFSLSQVDTTSVSEYICQFSTSNTVPTIVLPSGVTYANGWEQSDYEKNKKYMMYIINNYAFISCL